MKYLDFVKGISTLLLGTLMTYFTATGTAKAQSSPSQIMDSIVVDKEIFFDMHIYDKDTKQGVEGAGAEIYAKYSGEGTYHSFFNENFYNFDGEIFVDSNGDFDGRSFVIPVFDKVSTGVRDRQPLAPTGYALSNNYPEPFSSESSLEVLTKEREVADLVVYDILGQEVYRKAGVDLPAGKNVFSFRGLDKLPSGFYLFTAEGKNFAMAESGMKVKGYGFRGTSGRSSVQSNSYDNSGISVEKVGSGAYDASGFVANKSTKKNLEQEIRNERSVEDVLAKQGVYSSVSDDFRRAFDSLQVGWSKPGYWGSSMKAIPLYGVNGGKDTVVTGIYNSPPGFTFNVFSPGEGGVDTVTQHYNEGRTSDYANGFVADSSTFEGRVLLFYSEKGNPVNNIKFILPLSKK